MLLFTRHPLAVRKDTFILSAYLRVFWIVNKRKVHQLLQTSREVGETDLDTVRTAVLSRYVLCCTWKPLRFEFYLHSHANNYSLLSFLRRCSPFLSYFPRYSNPEYDLQTIHHAFYIWERKCKVKNVGLCICVITPQCRAQSCKELVANKCFENVQIFGTNNEVSKWRLISNKEKFPLKPHCHTQYS